MTPVRSLARPILARARGLAVVALLSGATGSGAIGCGDPVRNGLQDALGPEAPGVERGPLHRPNQPCLACHDGSTAPEFSVAGTLFVTSTERQPLVGGVVTITDARGAVYWTAANCVGNFYIVPSDFSPTYPFRVAVSYGGESVPMESLIHREGSCASCHVDPKGLSSAGHVYLDDLAVPTVMGCK